MKHLPKHLRPRYRYLAVELATEAESEIDEEAFQRAIWEETRALYGDVGSAEIDPCLIRFEMSKGTGIAIVRLRRGETNRARGALACIESINGTSIGLRIIGTSGTVRGCEEQLTRAGLS